MSVNARQLQPWSHLAHVGLHYEVVLCGLAITYDHNLQAVHKAKHKAVHKAVHTADHTEVHM